MAVELSKIPSEILEFLASHKTSNKIGEIAATHDIKDKSSKIAEIVRQLTLKEKSVSELPRLVQENLGLQDQEKINKITLDIAALLLQIRHYLRGVEDLIRSFGREVPETKPITPVSPERIEEAPKSEKAPAPESTMKQVQEQAPASPASPAPSTKEDIKTLIQKNPQIGSQEIGKQDIFTGENRAKMPPTINNWLQDYDYFLGVGWHSNLDRVRYLGQNENARKLSEKEKDILAKILESYDDEKALPFSLTPAGLLDLTSYTKEVSLKAPPKEPIPKEEPSFPAQGPETPLPPAAPKPPPTKKPKVLPHERGRASGPPPPVPPVPKENIIDLKEKSNGTISGPSIH